MAAKQTIYVDLDDVLCETARGWLAIAEREFGKTIHYDQLNTFEIGEACGLRAHEIRELVRLAHHPEELLAMVPIPEAVQVLNEWSEAGHEIAIVTGRPPASYEASLEWLERHRLPFHDFTIVDKYGRFATENTIAITLADLAKRKFSFAVEDSPTMAQYLAETMKVPVALLDRPWNRLDGAHALVARYKDWSEIAAAFPRSKR